MRHDERESRKKLHAKVPVRDTVDAVFRNAVEAQLFRGEEAVGRVGSSCKGAAAERGDVHALYRVVEPSGVAQKHHAVGKQMVCEGYRLGTLKVGVAGHYDVFVFGCLILKDGYQLSEERFHLCRAVAEVEAGIDCDLIVAASCGVELLSVVADALCQLAFDEHMDILGFRVDFQLSAFDIGEDGAESLRDIFILRRGDYAAFFKHCRVGKRAGDILAVHFLVERY